MIKIIIFCLVLFPFAVFGQVYPNISISMSSMDWLNTTGPNAGSGYGTVSINNDVLTVSFGGGWPSQIMKTGIVVPLNVTPSVPNMVLGSIMVSTYVGTGYSVKILNNNLVIYTSIQPEPLTTGGTFSYSGFIQCSPTLWYRDGDGDGFGTQATSSIGCPSSCAQISACTQPVGYVANNLDCDDSNNLITPNTIWYIDKDHDSYGDATYYNPPNGVTDPPTVTGCTQPYGYASNYNDCDDTNALINSGTIWYRDADADGLGDSSNFITSCLQPIGYVNNSNDTDDNPVCNYCASFNLIKNEKYLVSAWVQESNPNTPQEQFKNFDNGCVIISFIDVSGLPIATPQKFYATGEIIDGWQRIIGEFVVPATVNDMKLELFNGSADKTAYFDDIRILPSKGNMKSFVYDQATQRLMAELDENNYSTFYEYDLEGGLVRVKKETEKGVFTIQETRSGNAKLKE
jgi:hypothetical protein